MGVDMRAIASKVHCKWTADANQQLAKKCEACTTGAKRKWCADANQQLAVIVLGR